VSAAASQAHRLAGRRVLRLTSMTRPGDTTFKTLTVIAAILASMSLLTSCGKDDDTSGHETHTASNGDEFNDPDVDFASDMIQHQAQALAMVDLTMGRRLDPQCQQLAESIRAAQGPEIEQMTQWLTDWDQPIPETMRDHANAHGDGEVDMDSDMPGMMSDDQMAELEAAEGAEFQRMWLEMMIEHHEGAVEIARTEQSDGRFEPAVDLAKDIESTQKDEIATMEALLGS
jgi:uncharacterized protein (DUF305 family)